MESIFTIKNIILYLIIINLITFLAMYIDKKKAKKGKWRTKESTLFTLVLLGGGVGGICGMYLFRHKNKKARFAFGFPAILITEIAFIIIYVFTK